MKACGLNGAQYTHVTVTSAENHSLGGSEGEAETAAAKEGQRTQGLFPSYKLLTSNSLTPKALQKGHFYS